MVEKSVIITGAAGFTGYSTTLAFAKQGYKVYAVVRPASEHNIILKNIENVKLIELNLDEIIKITKYIDSTPDALIHLVWHAKRYDLDTQHINIKWTLDALDVAAEAGCKRFVCAGTQAEYGATSEIQREDMCPNPFCAYGAAKVSACYLSRYRAKERGIEWVWGRIFSLYGTNEPDIRMLPGLAKAFKSNEPVKLSSCRQNWDYLHVHDAAEALIALVEKGKDGEIYNIANGSYRPLKEFIEEAKCILGSNSEVIYGGNPKPFVSLQPSVEKIYRDTGWKPEISFAEGMEIGFEVDNICRYQKERITCGILPRG